MPEKVIAHSSQGESALKKKRKGKEGNPLREHLRAAGLF